MSLVRWIQRKRREEEEVGVEEQGEGRRRSLDTLLLTPGIRSRRGGEVARSRRRERRRHSMEVARQGRERRERHLTLLQRGSEEVQGLVEVRELGAWW